MKGIRRAIKKTLSGDGSAHGKRLRAGKKPDGPVNDAQIFCNDMYTVEYVTDALAAVAKDSKIHNIVLEDLIERNDRKIIQAVQDLFVHTTQSAKIDQEEARRESQRSVGKVISSISVKTKECERRVWKKITFVDCISDAQSYKEYLAQKGDIVAKLTTFLGRQGFQNDLPITFEAKIEIHTLLEGATILELLHSLQRDTTVTGVEFGGGLSHTERHIPEEFRKLIDPDSGTVKETIDIFLHYGKQSLNMELDNDDNPQSAGPGSRKQRRQSQLDESVLLMIRRMAMILEQIVIPNDFDASCSEYSSEVFDVGVGGQRESNGRSPPKDASDTPPSKKKDNKKPGKSDLFGNPIEDKDDEMDSSMRSEKSARSQKGGKPVKLDLFGNPLDFSEMNLNYDEEEDSGMNSSSARRKARSKSPSREIDNSRRQKSPPREAMDDSGRRKAKSKSPGREIDNSRRQQSPPKEAMDDSSRRKARSKSPTKEAMDDSSRRKARSKSPTKEAMDGSSHRKRTVSPKPRDDKPVDRIAEKPTQNVRVPKRGRFKRSVTLDGNKPTSTKGAPRRCLSVDDAFWEKGLDGGPPGKSSTRSKSPTRKPSNRKAAPIMDWPEMAKSKTKKSDDDQSEQNALRPSRRGRKKPTNHSAPLRRSSSEVLRSSSAEVSKPNMIKRSGTDSSPRSKAKKSLCFNDNIDPDFNWEQFSTPREPSESKAKSHSVVSAVL